MPTYTRYDESARLAVLEAHGEVTRDEAIAQFRAVCAELAARASADPDARYGVLLDTRHAANVPTPADIIAVLGEISLHGAALPPSRWALLARLVEERVAATESCNSRSLEVATCTVERLLDRAVPLAAPPWKQ